MTGATSLGVALPVTKESDHYAVGSLQEAVFQLSKNQSQLNDMVQNVIVDFQNQLIPNQQQIVDGLVFISTEMAEIRTVIKSMSETLITMQRVIVEKIKAD